ncbi:MAG: hypothetical protein ACE5JX_13095 [Acidobacteriota bacterium]
MRRNNAFTIAKRFLTVPFLALPVLVAFNSCAPTEDPPLPLAEEGRTETLVLHVDGMT